MAKPAALSSGLVAKKGAAMPVSAVQEAVPESVPVILPEAKAAPIEKPKKGEKAYFKALTVKLDRKRYLRLKQFGLTQDKSSQDLFVEAIDAYLGQAKTQ
ncbi:MAG: hypothetical protein WA888_18575 [Burkholderiaceae bacterium]